MSLSIQSSGWAIEPQIPEGLKLDSLSDLVPGRNPAFEECFKAWRALYWIKQKVAQDGSNVYYELLQTIETLAYTFDYMCQNPGKDMLFHIDVDLDLPTEQTLYIRPLAAWTLCNQDTSSSGLESGELMLPLVAVEWCYGARADDPNAPERFQRGFRQGTTFQAVDCVQGEMEVMLQILKENRRMLNDDDRKLKTLEKHCTNKGWNFSVVRPADPTKKDPTKKNRGAGGCEVCEKPADKRCNRCGVASYCSRDCQKSHWKLHKKSCEPKK
jgi:hypothetical protein